MSRLTSTQRPFAPEAIEALKACGDVREEVERVSAGIWARRYIWTGAPPEPADVIPFGSGDGNSYMAVHHRLWRTRGRAKGKPCLGGCGGVADQWAYMHTDPNEVTGPTKAGREDARVYSLDLDHYSPLCYPCHVRLDQPRMR